LVPPDVDIAATAGSARAAWYGVVWGRLGRGELAWAHWERVADPGLAPWLAAEQGRVLRELGLHVEAERLEAPALRRADDPAVAAMLQISLTADAVGRHDLAAARRRLAAAEEAITVVPDGPRAARQRLRLAWVTVEVAYLGGEAPSDEGLPTWDPVAAEPVLHPDHAWGSDFHTAKGMLFGGVVHRDVRLLDAAVALAPPVLAWGIHLARADLGVADALAAARAAWRVMVPPPGFEVSVATAPTARRLAGRGRGGALG
jgi:hypothetical protein